MIDLEELILKYAEFGILGVITLLLLTKGLTALTQLTQTTAKLAESQKALADSITKLTEKISNFGYQLAGIEKRLDKLEEKSEHNFGELRDLIQANYEERRLHK